MLAARSFFWRVALGVFVALGAAQAQPAPLSVAPLELRRVVIPGFPEGHTPAALNNATYVRYRQPNPAPAKTILVMMPGFLGGASSFTPLAKRILAQNPNLEVWVIDRRANQLEDHSALQQAHSTQNPLLAWRYYVRDAGTPQGFRPHNPKALAFLGHWGLKTTLEDLRRVILTAKSTGARVLLGGHSMGAVLTSLYAAWDFDGQAGFKDLDGLVLLDGAAGTTLANPITQTQYREGFAGPFGARTAGSNDLESGRATPYVEALGLGPASFAKNAAAALLAAFDPNGDSPGGILDFPASNLAAGMLLGDDDFALLPAFSVSCGFPKNALLGINVFAVLLNGLPGFSTASVVGLAPNAKRIEWDDTGIGAASGHEFTNPHEFAQSFYSPEADYQEWYFPSRLTLDIAVVGLRSPDWLQQELPLRHMNAVRLPTLAVVAGRGIVTDPKSFDALEAALGVRVAKKTAPGLTHLDVLSAQDNPTANWIVDFANNQTLR